jgi:glycosyltransferase involved in cell wall biosynthesis
VRALQAQRQAPDVEAMGAHPVIWVASGWVDEPRSGAGIRNHRMLAALRAHGVSVELVRGGWSGIRGRAVAALRAWPLSAVRAWTPRHARAVRAAQRGGAVVVADSLAGALVPELSARTVVTLHNVESRQVRAGQGGPRRGFDAWLERRGIPRLERRLLRSPASIVVVSQRDARILGRGLVVPNGADLPERAVAPAAGPPVFVGALDYAPNEDAVRWWVREVWPHVRSRTPLVVVGRRAGEVLRDLREHPAIELVGEVADVSPHLAAAAFAVVPLREGEGTRLKVVEAMAHGRAVIGTPKALEGLDFAERHGVVEAAGAEALAAAVDALAGDPARARQLGERARDEARRFAWHVVTLPFVDLVQSMLAGAPCRT